MLLITVKCTSVDHYGFQGRDYHPKESHIGQTFSVIEMREELFGSGGLCQTSDGIDYQSKAKAAADYLSDRRVALSGKEDSGVFKVLVCASDDGEIVTFIDHEIEILCLTLNGREFK